MRRFAGRGSLRPPTRRRGRSGGAVLAAAALALAVAACGGKGGIGPAASPKAGGSPLTTSKPAGPVKGALTVWVDAVRLPVAQAYAKTHPNVHMHIVTFDGDGNGATTLQTKIQLW